MTVNCDKCPETTGCTLCDSLYSRVCGDQTAKLVQEMKTNDVHVAQLSFLRDSKIKLHKARVQCVLRQDTGGLRGM